MWLDVPAVDVARKLFNRRQIFGVEPCRIGRLQCRRLLHPEDVRDDAVCELGGAGAFARSGGAIDCRRSVQPRDVPQQRAKCRCRRDDEIGDGAWNACSLDESLPQMNEMALDLCLARAAQVRTLDGGASERIGAEQHLMRTDDLGVLERERVQRPAKLIFRQDERGGDAMTPPALRMIRARLEVRHRDTFNESQTGERGARIQTVGDHRPKAVSEDTVQRCDELIAVGAGSARVWSRGRSSHEPILGYAPGQRMLIVDAQVHIWDADRPDRPWPAGRAAQAQKPYPVTKEMVLAAMDEAGVDRAVLIPPSWEGDYNDLVLAAAQAHPHRFAAMGRLAVENPESRTLIAG